MALLAGKFFIAEAGMGFSVREYSSKSNLRLLKDNHPQVLERLERMATGPAGSIVFSQGGAPNLTVEKDGRQVFLHPETDPVSEGRSFSGEIGKEFSGVEVMLGMGLGYGAKWALAARPKIRNLVVIENEPGFFLQALKYMDLTDLLSDSRVIIGITPDDAETLLEPANKGITLEDSQIVEHPVLVSLYQEDYTRVRKIIFEYINHRNIAGSTRAKFGETMVRNRLTHLKNLGHYHKFESLENAFEDIPAFIVAGGPSLDTDIRHLKKVEGRAVIFAVDTAVPAILDNDIRPDFISSIDYKDIIYEKIASRINEIPDDTCLIVLSSCTPLVQQNFPGKRKFFVLSENGIDFWLNSLVKGRRYFASGPSVAHLNFIAAKAMGCDPIIFVGQDLGFRTEKTHSKSAVMSYGDLLKKGIEDGRDILSVKSVDGTSLLTDRGMENMKNFFEKLIQDNPGQYINCTSGGAHIEGTTFMPIQSAVAQYQSRVTNKLKTLTRLFGKEDEIDVNTIAEGLKKDLEVVRDVAAGIKASNRQIKRIKAEIPGMKKKWHTKSVLSGKLRSMVLKLDKINSRNDGFLRVWQILEELTTQGLKQAEQMAFEIKMIEKDPARYPLWLDKSMERLALVNSVRMTGLDLLETKIRETIEYIRDEKLLLEKKSGGGESVSKLAEFYIRHKEYALARPLVESCYETLKEHADVNYFMGCLSAQERRFDIMNTFFQKAEGIDKQYIGRIDTFRRELGDQFVGIVEHTSQRETRVSKRFLAEGLKGSPFHSGLHRLIKQYAAEDIDRLSRLDEQNQLDESKDVVMYWSRLLDDFPHLHSCLENDNVGYFLYFQGKLMYGSSDKNEALHLFRKGVGYLSLDDALHLKIADFLLCAFDFENGVPYLNRAIGLNAENKFYWERFGDFLFHKGRIEEAISAYEQAEQHFPGKTEISEKKTQCWLQKGNRYHQQGEFDSAKQCYLEGINSSPEDGINLACLYNNLGSAFKNMGKAEQAMASYDKALDILPGYVDALYNKGELFHTIGDHESALAYYKKVVDKQPDMTVAYQKLGELFSAMGEMDQAAKMFKQAHRNE